MKLLFIGPARTGTTYLWSLLFNSRKNNKLAFTLSSKKSITIFKGYNLLDIALVVILVGTIQLNSSYLITQVLSGVNIGKKLFYRILLGMAIIGSFLLLIFSVLQAGFKCLDLGILFVLLIFLFKISTYRGAVKW
jgi:hypothetical protein